MLRALTAVLVLAVSVAAAREKEQAVREEFAAGLAALALRDFGNAERLFRAVVAADPASHEALNNLGVALAEQGQEEDASAQLRAALRVRPDYDRARENLAAVYVRLAAKELLAAAERADPPRRQALAAAAREILEVGPHLAPGDLVARAERLAGLASEPARPSPPDRDTRSPAPMATVTEAVPTTVARAAIRVAVEPVGATILSIDPTGRVARAHRRARGGLVQAGEWPLEIHGRIGTPSVLTPTKTSDWSVHLFDIEARRPAIWAIESAAKRSKGTHAVVLSASDLRAATSGLVAGRDFVLVAADAGPLELDSALAAGLRDRLEAWRVAWSERDFDAYEKCYTPDFVGQPGRTRDQWAARKRELFARSGSIRVELQEVSLVATPAVAITRFRQLYESSVERSRSDKRLLWRWTGDTWRIAAEELISERPLSAKPERTVRRP